VKKIDMFNHFFPKAFFEKMCAECDDPQTLKRYVNLPMLVDLDARLAAIDRHKDYSQILSLPSPPIEELGSPEATPPLARIGNDGLAELCDRRPDHFPGFIAALPMNNMAATMDELHRAMGELGAKGVQIYTNVNGRPLDDPEFWPLFEAMAAYDMPIWVHPTRGPETTDYRTEEESLYEIWWTFGWPYETSVFMARMVFGARLFDRLPDIKVITHHLGGLVPYFEGRVGPGWDAMGKRTVKHDYTGLLGELKRPHREYFKMFYADTAVFGARAATYCGLEYFGPDKVIFASDSPFDPEGGTMFIRETIKICDELEVEEDVRRKIYEGNAARLMKLDG
jgi:uncharacterized protein